MILLIDNYDSFTYNLAQYLSEFDETIVLYNQDPHLYDMAKKADALVFSPGPIGQKKLTKCQNSF